MSRFAFAFAPLAMVTLCVGCLDIDDGFALLGEDDVLLAPIDVRFEGDVGPITHYAGNGAVRDGMASQGNLNVTAVSDDGRVMAYIDLYNLELDNPDVADGVVTACADEEGNEAWTWDVSTDDTAVDVVPCDCDDEDAIDVVVTARLADEESRESIVVTRLRMNEQALRDQLN